MRMNVTRRTFLGGATALAGAAALSGLAFAETYPSKPISYIVPYNPGGASDVIARLIAEKITAKTGQQVVIDYKTGAGGAIGANYFFRQPPDGYTLMAGTTSFFTTIPRSQPIEYDPDKDLIPVAMTGESYLPLAVHPSVPATTAAELFAYAKANPGKLTFASSGIGTGGHLVYEYLQMRLGIEMIHVPYKGASEALNALAAGEVDIGVDTGSTEFILDGRLRGLAVLNKKRWDRLPDVPTIEEAGLPDWPIRSWHTGARAGRHAEGDRDGAERHDQRVPHRPGGGGQAAHLRPGAGGHVGGGRGGAHRGRQGRLRADPRRGGHQAEILRKHWTEEGGTAAGARLSRPLL